LPRKLIHSKIHRIRKRSIPQKKKLFLGARIFKLFLTLFFIGTLSSIFFLGTIWFTLPDVRDVEKLGFAESTTILDREGNILYTIHGEENRIYTPLNEISPFFIKATLAIEDDRFYSHYGFDLPAITKAILSELGFGKPRGGSTITQQFIKNTFLNSERSYLRKLREIMLAIKLESAFTKDQILEMYLNRIPYGSNAFGVGKAAQTFFHKPPSKLTLSESAILASLPKAPTKYSPFGSNKKDLLGYRDVETGEYISGRKDIILKRMFELNLISETEMRTAEEIGSKMIFTYPREEIKSPHFVMWIRELLEDKYGRDIVAKGGLRVTTTLDPKLQDLAEKLISEGTKENEEKYGVKNSALVALNPKNGQVLAMIGSRDYFDIENDGQVNVTIRPRPAGSSFKPIVYTTAFLQRMSPATMIFDTETDFGEDYKPKNFNGRFNGLISLRHALANSLNIPAIKLTVLLGVNSIVDLAEKLGITTLKNRERFGASFGIGAGEVTLLELTRAFGVLGNSGVREDLHTFLKIEDSQGNVLEKWSDAQNGLEVVEPQAAYLTTDILSDQSARPANWNYFLSVPGHDIAVKTGTSNKKIKKGTEEEIVPSDLWTIGYTPSLAVGVWSGNNDGSEAKMNADGLNVSGSIWNKFLRGALENIPNEKFVRPAGIKEVTVSRLSGLLPTEIIPEENRVTETFSSYSVPLSYDNVFTKVKVDILCGDKLPNEWTPPEAIEEKVFVKFHSELPQNTKWEGSVQNWLKKNWSTPPLVPTETCEKRKYISSEQQPSVSILTPKNGSVVLAGSATEIDLTTKAPLGILRVEYYLDEILKYTATEAPFFTKINLPTKETTGTAHTIKIKLLDQFYNSAYASVNIYTGQDRLPPSITLIAPTADTILPADGKTIVNVEANDPGSSVKSVKLFLDNQEITSKTIRPFIFYLELPNDTNSHILKVQAEDLAGNSSSLQKNIILQNTKKIEFTSDEWVKITQPINGTTYAVGGKNLIEVQINPLYTMKIEQLEIILQKGVERTRLANFSAENFNNQLSGEFQFYFNLPTEPTEFEIFARVRPTTGRSMISEKIKLKTK